MKQQQQQQQDEVETGGELDFVFVVVGCAVGLFVNYSMLSYRVSAHTATKTRKQERELFLLLIFVVVVVG